MKNIAIVLISLFVISCKSDRTNQDTVLSDKVQTVKQSKALDRNKIRQEGIQAAKREQLLSEKDDKVALENLIDTKTFYKKEDSYVLNYKYPYLNEEIKSSYRIFNEYMQDRYIEIETSVNDILKNNSLSCDPSVVDVHRYKRIIDYKVYNKKEHLISILLYKANHYSDKNHHSYMFKCLNFDLNNTVFLDYQSIFKEKSEAEMLSIINQKLTEKIIKKNSYKDCWVLSEDSFDEHKNNFVITEKMIKFYFDDCVICPSYAGRYAVEVPLDQIAHLLQENNKELVL
ncbi:RsiV family protein [Aquimarina sp. MMG016]|uniref:RsiV family protein n=1 Tax=Aquimarina sp. MMG016 TaxID=2822690 RepID=UPI001B3A66F8|nr:RsiV family protein [Aquimarina sp. MMG016]MBQ4819922.1 DUF3298 domain-containing protein [Aquimarina sp. MMG016]